MDVVRVVIRTLCSPHRIQREKETEPRCDYEIVLEIISLNYIYMYVCMYASMNICMPFKKKIVIVSYFCMSKGCLPAKVPHQLFNLIVTDPFLCPGERVVKAMKPQATPSCHIHPLLSTMTSLITFYLQASHHVKNNFQSSGVVALPIKVIRTKT